MHVYGILEDPDLPFPVSSTIHLPPNAGTFSLDRNPVTVSLTSGGSNSGGYVDASYLGSGCVGYGIRAPDVRIHIVNSGMISFGFNSQGDTTLIINDANGDWHCDDDGGSGVNPELTLHNAPAGQYDIWVGSFDRDENYSGTLRVSTR